MIIFDECHRSQFGDMHTAITQGVQALQPVRVHRYADLRGQRRQRRQPELRTTAQAFGCFLHGDPAECPPEEHQMAIHAYTIVDAISDKNVLPFRIDYVNTIKLPEGIDRQAGVGDRHRAGAAGTGAAAQGRRLHA